MILSHHYHFTAREWRALLTCACDDFQRVSMYGIAFDPESLTAHVTDGHRMLVATASKVNKAAPDPALGGVLPRAVADAAGKAAGAGGVIVVTPHAAGWTIRAWRDVKQIAPMLAEMILYDTEIVWPPGAATFEAERTGVTPVLYRAVMPSADPSCSSGVTPVALTPAYLAEVMGALDKLGCPHVTVWPAHGVDPVCMIATDLDAGTTWRYVQMPMRDDTRVGWYRSFVTGEQAEIAETPAGAAETSALAPAETLAERDAEIAERDATILAHTTRIKTLMAALASATSTTLKPGADATAEIAEIERERDEAIERANDMERQCDDAIERADAAEEKAALTESLRAALGCDPVVAMYRAGLAQHDATADDVADAIAAWIDAAMMRRAG